MNSPISSVILGHTVLQAVHLQGIVRNSGRAVRTTNVSLPLNWAGEVEQGAALSVFWWPNEWEFFESSASIDSAYFQVAEKTRRPNNSRKSPLDDVEDSDSDESTPSDEFYSKSENLKSSMVDFLAFDQNRAADWATRFAMDKHFLAAKLNVPTSIDLELTIDTDNRQFLDWTKTAAFNPSENKLPMTHVENGQCILLLGLRIIAPTQKPMKWLGEKNAIAGAIAIHFSISDLLPAQGVLGFDIGNNNSTIAFLSNDAAGDHSQIKLLVADPAVANNRNEAELTDLSAKEESVLSAVRITEYQQQASSPNFPRVERKVGKEAVEITSLSKGQLFPSAKRILADLSQSAPLDLMLEKLHRIDRVLPAELLATTLVQRVHQTLRMHSFPVVATYPSTYTKAEIERVRFAISKALHRGLNRFGVDEKRISKVGKVSVPRLYDEATAAAFFYIYRDFIRGPGRLNGLHFLYPRGVNLLLFDCGGGTTDIALIHVHTLPDGKLGGDSLWGVKLTNLGRTGNRYFGGDDITSAFFRVLKWYFAHAIDNSLTAPPAESGSVTQETVSQLQALAGQIDKVIPTKADNKGIQAIGSTKTPLEKQKIQALRVLWDFSEQVKAWVSSAEPDFKSKSIEQLEKFVGLINKKGAADVRALFGNVIKSLKKEVLRRIVDLLIKPEVDATLNAANALIGELDKRLSSMVYNGSVAPSFVHHVYIVGRAAHYPYIRERLENDLRVPFLSKIPQPPIPDDLAERALKVSELGVFHPRLVFDTKNLKGAVVRGAVLMRMAENLFQRMHVVYDEQLSERLPFSIGLDSNVAGPETFFHEHERYSQLPPVTMNAPQVPPDSPRQSVVLHRRYPGTEVWEPFLEFVFDPPVEGLITISFNDVPENRSTLGFQVTHKTPDGELIFAVGRIISTRPPRSPLEGGDL